jgi:hypothetical protein
MRILTSNAGTLALRVQARLSYFLPQVGRTAVIPVADYLGFTATVKAQTATYYTVQVTDADGEKRTATVWSSAGVIGSKAWTADYQNADFGGAVGITETTGLRAALDAALWHTANRLAFRR